jgi:hypothetical protein
VRRQQRELWRRAGKRGVMRGCRTPQVFRELDLLVETLADL